jgi:zinc transporter ZupT
MKLFNFMTYILLIGLCIDGLFEGIAIGVQDRWEKIVFVAFGLLMHKMIIGLSLGIALKKAQIDFSSFIYCICLFAIFPSLGILLGYLLTDIELAQAILLSLSSGAFLYVSGSVIVIEEFTGTKYRWSKYLLLLFGIGLTAGVKILGHI